MGQRMELGGHGKEEKDGREGGNEGEERDQTGEEKGREREGNLAPMIISKSQRLRTARILMPEG